MHKFSVIALSLSILLAGCSNEEIVGEVNGRDITVAEFERYLRLKNIPADDEARVDRVLKDFMQREALAASIENSQRIDSALIDAEVNEFRKQVLISRYFEDYLNEKVSEDATRNYYNTHSDEFQRERVKVAHVLIRTNPGMSDAERQAALTRAQEAYSKARSGMSFTDVARQYSEDTVSAKSGGELGWLVRGAIDPVFSEKIFASQAGDISEPFRTSFGFHVVKILENPEVSQTPLEQVKGNIRYRLRQQSKQAEMDRLMSEAKIIYR